MIRMEGEVYFGAVVARRATSCATCARRPAAPKHLLVMSKSMNFIDLAAADMWRAELTRAGAASAAISTSIGRARRCSSSGSASASSAELGTDHIFPAKRIAIATIFDRLDRGICAHCTVRVFEECQGLPLPIDGAASDASPGSRARSGSS